MKPSDLVEIVSQNHDDPLGDMIILLTEINENITLLRAEIAEFRDQEDEGLPPGLRVKNIAGAIL